MDDLSGLSWNAGTSSSQNQQQSSRVPYNALSPSISATARVPSPLSGRPNVASNNSGPKPAGQDSFAALLAPNAGKKANGLTLAEKQRQLQQEKLKQAQRHDPFATHDTSVWDSFGSGRNTPAQRSQPTSRSQSTQPSEDLDDILAAFNASAPVDASSHFPPPQIGNSANTSQPASTGPTTANSRSQSQAPHGQRSLLGDDDEDDDPFGLAEFSKKGHSVPTQSMPTVQDDAGDDDILGMLGKPVEEVKRPGQTQSAAPPRSGSLQDSSAGSMHPQAKAVAELVDMGFPPDKARRALEQTETGMDTQAAISWLLTQAHDEAKSNAKAKELAQGSTATATSRHEPSRRDANLDNDTDDDDLVWRRQPTRPDRNDSRSPNTGDRDVAQYATQISGSLFKSATTLWKTGQKRAQKVIAEYQQRETTGDPSQPKWMRDAELRAAEQSAGTAEMHEERVTNEAMMLEPGIAPPSRRAEPSRGARNDVPLPSRSPRPLEQIRTFEDDPVLGARPQALPSRNRYEEAPRQGLSRPHSRPVEKLSRQAVEEESAQAYISPARRKKAVPTEPPVSAAPNDESMDIFSDMPAPSAAKAKVAAPATSRPSAPVRARPRTVARSTPAVSPTALSQSTKQRQLGGEAFKRGDYGEATSFYTAALSPLPPSHPITIVLHSNRALTHLKTGDAKSAIIDADAALSLIGPARGEDEYISFGAGEADKPMKEFHGKALMRKAEAYEHLEKWSEASKVWHEAVEAGVGGSVSIAGRNRCEKAAAGPSAAAAEAVARPVQTKVPLPKQPIRKRAPSTMSMLSSQESEAVSRLRAANAAAAQASDEAFALTDAVTARIDGWKGGKEGNLRALLASLDTVLWTGANWTKVGMGDLIMPNRVKVIYMKAIARVHPDKLAQDATTEHKMVSASVFAALNEGWDKFKRDNNM